MWFLEEFFEVYGKILLVSCVIITLAACVGFAKIAEEKGYDRRKYLLWCFFGGLLGYMMVIALPDRSEKNAPSLESTEKDNKEITEKQKQTKFYICPYCGYDKLKRGDSVCENCGGGFKWD